MKKITKRIYGKDLHDEYLSVSVRLDTDEIDHGDLLRIDVEKIEDDDIENNE